MKEKQICSICGKELSKEEMHEFDGKILCKHCLDRETALCSCCGIRIWADDSYGDEYTVLCKSCYNDYYTRCERCDCLLHRDNANYFDGSLIIKNIKIFLLLRLKSILNFLLK